MSESVLCLDGLNVTFTTPEGPVRAVDGVSLTLRRGETLAVVGESGSGKTATFLAAMGLLARNGRTSGRALLNGVDLLALSPRALDRLRGADIAMIFQDPMTALNPTLRLSTQLVETLRVHRRLSRRAAAARAVDMLKRVGIPDPERRFRQYPHELSGGMRQRVMVAMALLCDPAVLIADEPTTALDVTIQAQVLELLRDLSRDFNTATAFITHDLGVVAAIADRVAVMYAGRVVEEAPVEAFFRAPAHPYSAALLASTPRPDQRPEDLRPIPGSPPNMQHLPPGCAFAPRCPFAQEACRAFAPSLAETAPDRAAACLFPLGAPT